MLFAGKSSEAMASGLIRLLQHREMWPTAEQCRSHVLENYTWDRVSKQVDSVFNHVIDQHMIAYGGNGQETAGKKGGREQDEGSLFGSYR